MTATAKYTIEQATEWGVGVGPNGTGRRAKVIGFYVVDITTSRRIRAFKGKDAEAQAIAWAAFCNENF